MNLRAVRTLVAAQLKTELRHPKTGKFGPSRVGITALAYGFSGLVLALSLGTASPEQVIFVAGSFGLVLAAFGIAGSYDELMGRPKDNAWLTTLPASEHEHYLARIVAIGAYVALVAISVAIPVAVRTGMAHGVEAGLSVGTLVAGGMMWTSAVGVASLWALTLALPFKLLQPALAATRTLLVAMLVLGYQWVGSQPDAASAPWWPAAWLADALTGRPTLGLALLLGSVGLMTGTYAALFPGRYFSLLNKLADGAAQMERQARGRKRLTLPEQILVRNPASRAAYGFALSAFRDDRLVRGRLWPAALLPLGFAFFGWWMGGLGDLFIYGPENVLAFPETRLHLSLVVILLFCGQSLVQTLQVSDHAEASWAFDTLPGARPRRLQLGAQQALLYRVLLPLHVILAAVLAMIMSPFHAAIHAGFWFAVVAVATRIHSIMHRKKSPFSQRTDRFSAGARFVPLLVSIPAALGVLVIQTFTFTDPKLALAAILGLLVINAGLARMVAWTPRRYLPQGLTPEPPRPASDALAVDVEIVRA